VSWLTRITPERRRVLAAGQEQGLDLTDERLGLRAADVVRMRLAHLRGEGEQVALDALPLGVSGAQTLGVVVEGLGRCPPVRFERVDERVQVVDDELPPVGVDVADGRLRTLDTLSPRLGGFRLGDRERRLELRPLGLRSTLTLELGPRAPPEAPSSPPATRSPAC
jgi:hypothetical protein